MSRAKIIKIDDFHAWLDHLIKKYRVVAPQKIAENETGFKSLKSSGDIVLEYVNPIVSPVRDLLFPKREVMIRYEKKGKGWETEVKEPGEKTVLFGIRSCDLSALQFMDRFFLEGFKDNYYSSKRENLIVVNMTCTDPAESCFCVCADAGPAKEEGFDLQLTRISDTYLVEIGSSRGEALIGIDVSLFKDAGKEDLEKKEDIINETKINRFRMPTTYFSRAIRRITADDIDEKLWDRLGTRCIGCGSCSFVCPTCTCFQVIDEPISPDEGARVRTWDSCMYSGFTREVSGHNPRALPKDRVKRRYYHKLSYYYLKKMGTHGCVGCGRCVVSCMGSIDMFVVSKEVRRNR